MRKWVGCVAALVFVTVAACGGDDETSETTTTTAAPTTTPSTAQLEAMLLTADDMEGWMEGWEVAPLNEEGLAGPEAPCEGATLDPTVAEGLTAGAGIDGRRTDGNASLLERLITGEPEPLDADLDAYRDAFESCLTTPPMFQELALPELGDQQWAFVGTPAGWPTGSGLYLAYVRVGTVAVNLVTTEQPVQAGAELQITDEEFVQLLRKAAAKVGG